MSRLDIHLPYGNSLAILAQNGRLFVRLVMIVNDRPTCATPMQPIEVCALRDLMSVPYAEFDLGEIKLTADPKCLIVHFGFRHIPVEHEAWKPMMAGWLEKLDYRAAE